MENANNNDNQKGTIKYFLIGGMAGIILILTAGISGFYLGRKSNLITFSSSTPSPIRLPTPTLGECSRLSIDQYRIINFNEPGYFREKRSIKNPLLVDLNEDGQKEKIIFYEQMPNEVQQRELPIIVKIFSNNPNCPQEKFSYIAKRKEKGFSFNFNELGDVKVFNNFWGEGGKTVMFIPIETGYGSSDRRHIMFLTYKDSAYQIINGPLIGSTDFYRLAKIEPYGKKILVARAIWLGNECHYCSHYYYFELWQWQKEKYVYTENHLGTTQDKYSMDQKQNINDMLSNELLLKNYRSEF